MTSSTSSPAESAGLQLKGITKTFGSFVANDAIDLDVRPGTQSGTEQVLRGRGVPDLRGARGNVVVTLAVETPSRLDPRQEELPRELAAIRGEEQPEGAVKPAHKSVFNRLRDAFNTP